MTISKPKKAHHHGNLKAVLIAAGIELLSEGGHSALTLRQCAARAGVSHAAPAHHFNGLKGLLTAIVAEGFRAFTQAMIVQRDVAASDPLARLIAVGNGYLAFAKNHEAMSTLMFMTSEININDPDFQTASAESYQVLADACAPFKPGLAGQKGIEILIWSLVQGYASLTRTGQVDTDAVPFSDILPLLDLKEQ